MTKILFITSNRLGDGVLSTGALDHLIKSHPDADITVACGPLVAGIFASAPRVTQVIPLNKEPRNGHWMKLWKQVVTTRWDIVVDFRNSAVSRLICAKKRYIWGKQDKNRHKVEQAAQVIKATPPPAPTLWFDEATQNRAIDFIPDDNLPVLAIGPAANWQGKTWPADNFIDLINRLTKEGSILPQARVAIFAAPGEEAIAQKVLQSITPENRRIDVIAKAGPLTAAATIARCDFYIGNDSGLMHSAAAAKVPTLGLFGPSWPHLYAPWGAHCSYISTPESYDELIDYEGYAPETAPCLMTSLSVDMAEKAAIDLWNRIRNA